jgi:hypothetical protein
MRRSTVIELSPLVSAPWFSLIFWSVGQEFTLDKTLNLLHSVCRFLAFPPTLRQTENNCLGKHSELFSRGVNYEGEKFDDIENRKIYGATNENLIEVVNN